MLKDGSQGTLILFANIIYLLIFYSKIDKTPEADKKAAETPETDKKSAEKAPDAEKKAVPFVPSKCKPSEPAEIASDALTTSVKANKFAGSASASSADSGFVPKTNKFAKKRSSDFVPDTPLKVRTSDIEVMMFVHENIPVGVHVTSDSFINLTVNGRYL